MVCASFTSQTTKPSTSTATSSGRSYLRRLALIVSLVLGASSIGATAALGAGSSKPEAAITVHHTSPSLFADVKQFSFLVIGHGDPPPHQRLVDASGRVAATASFASYSKDGDCGNLARRDSGQGPDRWCVTITGLKPGAEATGTAKNSLMTLKLTVAVRHRFWLAPFGVVLVGLLLAGLVAWLSTNWFPQYLNRQLVDRAVATGEALITGLAEWVKKQRVKTSDTMLRPLVNALISEGPVLAAQARARLQSAVAASGLPPTHPIRASATAEAKRTDHRIDDFYKDDGSKREHHPADEQLALLNRADTLQARLDRASARIRTLPLNDRKALEQIYGEAAAGLNGADSDGALSEAEAEISELWRKVNDETVRASFQEEDIVEPSVVGTPVAVFAPAPHPSTLSSVEPGFKWTLRAVGATALVVCPLAAIAIGAVAKASYTVNAVFGVWSDYLSLFLASLGSSAVAGIVAVFLLWSAKKV